MLHRPSTCLKRALGGVALLVLLALPQATLAEGRSAPEQMIDRLLATPLPGRNPVDLAIRLRGLDPNAVPSRTPTTKPLEVGQQQAFWILDQRSAQLFQEQATVRLLTDHAYWFVESDLADKAPQEDLERSASVFESKTYPLIHRYFGTEPSPGVDGDPRIVFLLANVPSVAAYFSSADAFPRAINPRSNEHEMIYVNLNALRPGQQAFDSTIVHEFQHMVHFARCPNQEGWIDEGSSELAMRVAGYDSGPPQALMSQPAVQLNAWSSQGADLVRHYQAAYLFLRYVAERAGGWDALPTLLQSSCMRGEALIGNFLAQDPIAPDVDSLFTEWATANLIQDPAVADGRFAYATNNFRVTTTGAATAATPFLGTVPQYAPNYVDLPQGGGTATFTGDTSVPLVDAPVDGAAWWSNRGDNLDSRLTRTVDLSGLSQASLHFQAWYDLENQFDYVYLSASSDGGATWQVLPATNTATDQATGNNFGPGWTGSTNGQWVDESVDLSPLAGAEVLLRFEYVTDQSYNGPGFALRNLAIPELAVSEPGAFDEPWSAEGWVRVDAPVLERWNLRLVRWRPDGVVVEPLGVALDGTATFPLDPTATRSTLVIAPTAPRTLVSANYSLSIAP